MCIADSIKVALGIGKLFFGGHSCKSLHCSLHSKAQCAITIVQCLKLPMSNYYYFFFYNSHIGDHLAEI